MTAPNLFLFVSLVGAAFTASALLKARRISAFSMPYFMGAWLTGELPLHHLAWQAVATLIFGTFGAFEAAPGLLGLAITFASWAGLLYIHATATAAPDSNTPTYQVNALGVDDIESFKFSPDSQTLAFRTDDEPATGDGQYQIRVIASEGSGVAELCALITK